MVNCAMKIYIAGPIASMDLSVARKEFERACDLLVANGFGAINPMEYPPVCGGDCQGDKERKSDRHARHCYLRWDMVIMLTHADGVALLDGWEQSLGAKAESYVAQHCGLPVMPIDKWLKGCGYNA
jgi:hypothetical protein